MKHLPRSSAKMSKIFGFFAPAIALWHKSINNTVNPKQRTIGMIDVCIYSHSATLLSTLSLRRVDKSGEMHAKCPITMQTQPSKELQASLVSPHSLTTSLVEWQSKQTGPTYLSIISCTAHSCTTCQITFNVGDMTQHDKEPIKIAENQLCFVY